MPAWLRMVLSFLAGVALAFVLVVALELFSSIFHPTPPGFTGTEEEMCEHVRRIPHWLLAVAVVAWGATAFASTWVTTRLGRFVSGIALGLLLLGGLVFNVSMLPYPIWFKIATLVCVPLAILLGVRLAHRPKAQEQLVVPD